MRRVKENISLCKLRQKTNEMIINFHKGKKNKKVEPQAAQTKWTTSFSLDDDKEIQF